MYIHSGKERKEMKKQLARVQHLIDTFFFYIDISKTMGCAVEDPEETYEELKKYASELEEALKLEHQN
jgi:hypothetical protein